MKTFKFLVMVACYATAALASAQQTVEDRKAVLDAQIELARREKELDELLRARAGTSASGLPVVVSVSVGVERIARLQLPNGVVGHYREGDSVRPGMVVSSIAPRQVFVAITKGKGKRTALPLEFAGPVMAVGMGAVPGAVTQAAVPDALLPAAPVVNVPAIEVIPAAKPAPVKSAAPAAAPAAPGK